LHCYLRSLLTCAILSLWYDVDWQRKVPVDAHGSGRGQHHRARAKWLMQPAGEDKNAELLHDYSV